MSKYVPSPVPRRIFRRQLPRFDQACHYPRNISHSAIRTLGEEFGDHRIDVSIGPDKISALRGQKTEAGSRYCDAERGRRRRSLASLGLFQRDGKRDRERRGRRMRGKRRRGKRGSVVELKLRILFRSLGSRRREDRDSAPGNIGVG